MPLTHQFLGRRSLRISCIRARSQYASRDLPRSSPRVALSTAARAERVACVYNPVQRPTRLVQAESNNFS